MPDARATIFDMQGCNHRTNEKVSKESTLHMRRAIRDILIAISNVLSQTLPRILELKFRGHVASPKIRIALSGCTSRYIYNYILKLRHAIRKCQQVKFEALVEKVH